MTVEYERMRQYSFNIVPLRYKEKKPPAAFGLRQYFTRKSTDEEHKAWFDNGVQHNLGVITGLISECIVIDIDSSEVEVIWIEKTKGIVTQDTLQVKTSRGKHIYYKFNKAEFPTGINSQQLHNGGPHKEIKLQGNNQYVAGPGSIHPDGPIYTANDKAPQTVTKAEFDRLFEAFGTTAGHKTPIAELWKDDYIVTEGNGRRPDIFKLSCDLIRRNHTILSREQIRQMVIDWINEHCDPPVLINADFERQFNNAWRKVLENKEPETTMDEPNQEKIPRMIVCNTLDEWYVGLAERYQAVKQFAEKEFTGVWPVLEFGLSIRCILNIRDITLPFAGIVLGKPSSNKTLGLEMFRDDRHSFHTDDFTPRSFVSHYTVTDPEDLTNVDLLPKIKDKIMTAPELGVMFSKKDDDLIELLGILTRVLDGNGYESDSGVHGHRGYKGEHMFTLLGAAVDIPRKVYKHLGNLGPKLYFFRMPQQKTDEDEYLDQLENDTFAAKRKELKSIVSDLLSWLDGAPVEEINGHGKIQWGKDDRESLREIVRLAKLLARLRGTIPTWETQGTQGTEYSYALPVIEEPARAMRVLTNLAKGHALSNGRTSVGVEDIDLVRNVVLSTAPRERVEVLNLLIDNEGTLTTDEVMKGLSTSKPTALRTMTELRVLGLVDYLEGDQAYHQSACIQLKEEFAWCLEARKEKLPRTSANGKRDQDDSPLHGGQISLRGNLIGDTSQVN